MKPVRKWNAALTAAALLTAAPAVRDVPSNVGNSRGLRSGIISGPEHRLVNGEIAPVRNNFSAGTVAYALVRAASRLFSTHGRPVARRRHKWRHSTHDCVRY